MLHNIDDLFSSFHRKLNTVVNNHETVKILSKRKIKQLAKPWITKGILTSIRIKNRLYMSGDHAQYKNYRNTISKLTRISKKQYYSQFFSNNIKNMQKTWEGINTLLNRKKKTSMKIDCLKQPNSNTTANMKSRIPRYYERALYEHWSDLS